MRKMHDQMTRLYEAARAAKRLDSPDSQSEMAQLFNVGSQYVYNWEKRGPSKDALLLAQDQFGINATWVLSGRGPMFVGGDMPIPQQWPFERIDIRRVLRLEQTELAFVEGKLEAAIEMAEARILEKKSDAA